MADYSDLGFEPEPQASPKPAAPQSQPSGSWLDSVVDYTKGLWNTTLGTIPQMAQTVNEGYKSPRSLAGPVGHILVNSAEAADAMRLKAEDAFKNGDYGRGVRHVIEWLIPMIGPQASGAGDKAAEGKVAEALGEATGIGVSNALGARSFVGPKFPKVPVKKTFRPTLNPVQQNAVEVAREHGMTIPPDVATQNKFLQGARNILEKQPFTSAPLTEFRNSLEAEIASNVAKVAEEVAPRAARAKLNAGTRLLNVVGDKAAAETAATADQGTTLAESVAPGATTTKLGAGSNAFNLLKDRLTALAKEADTVYKRVKATARKPENTTQVQVGEEGTGIFGPDGNEITRPVYENVYGGTDYGSTKASAKPLIDKLEKDIPLAQRQMSPGYTVLRQIMDRPDTVSLETALDDLSAIQNIARNDLPAVRSASQGIAAYVIKPLRAAVDAAAGKLGEDALADLNKGRELTTQKHALGKTLKTQLRTNPVRFVNRLIANDDAGVELLGTVARETPQTLPHIARATVETLFKDPRKGAATWAKMGDKTRQVLFGDKANGIGEYLTVYDGVSRSKSGAGALLKELSDNPVHAIEQLAAKEDSGFPLLQKVQIVAPESLPDVARSILEHIIENATSKGGYRNVDSTVRMWNQLGPQTKNLLFGAEKSKELDGLFNWGKMVGENPNPPGTAAVASIAATTALAVHHPMIALASMAGARKFADFLMKPAGAGKAQMAMELDLATGSGRSAALNILNGKETERRPVPVSAPVAEPAAAAAAKPKVYVITAPNGKQYQTTSPGAAAAFKKAINAQ